MNRISEIGVLLSICLIILPAIALGADASEIELYVNDIPSENIPSNDPNFDFSVVGVGMTYYNVIMGSGSVEALSPLRERFVEIFIEKSDPEQLQKIAEANDMDPSLFNDPTIIESYVIGLITPNLFPEATIYKNAVDTRDYERRLQEMLMTEFGMEADGEGIPFLVGARDTLFRGLGIGLLLILLFFLVLLLLRKRNKKKALRQLDRPHHKRESADNPLAEFKNAQDDTIDDLVLLIQTLEEEEKDNVYGLLDQTIDDVRSINEVLKDPSERAFEILNYFAKGYAKVITPKGPQEYRLDRNNLVSRLNKKITRTAKLGSVLDQISNDVHNEETLSIKSENKIITPEQTKHLKEFLDPLARYIHNLKDTWNPILRTLEEISRTLDQLKDADTERKAGRKKSFESIQTLIHDYEGLVTRLHEWNRGNER